MNDINADPHVINRQGCPIHYWLTGPSDKPLIVFTHGVVMDHTIFDNQVHALSKYYRVLTWDVRGHGLSRPMGEGFSINQATEDLIAILNHINCHQATLVGHSMGGYISQELLFKYPDRVNALTVIGSSCITIKQPATVKLMAAISTTVFALTPNIILRWLMSFSAGVKDDVKTQANRICRLVPKNDFIKIWRQITHCYHHEKTYRIEVPLLITHGQYDNKVGFGYIKRLTKIWARQQPKCDYVMIPNAGHNAHQDNPEYFNKILRNFLCQKVFRK